MIRGVATGPPIQDQPDRRSPDGEGLDDKTGRRPAPPPTASAEEDRGRGTKDLRLVVETDAATGALSYLWVDRHTGQVVSRLSREDVARMNNDPKYAAGAWLDTKI